MHPALILHGSFDFSLFVGGAIQFIYNIESIGFEVVGIVITVIMTVVSTCWAYHTYKKVEKDFSAGWQAFANDDDNDDIEMIVLWSYMLNSEYQYQYQYQ